nr:hypothetical protein GCM10020063_023810 [Dactylosporangium thailandense]
MAIPIPGAEVLGFGFNVFGEYDPSSRTSPMFDVQYDASREWQSGGVTYLLPANAAFDPSGASYGEVSAFSSRQQFEQHFTAKVTTGGRYGFFSGEFTAQYNHLTTSDDDYQYGLLESYAKIWSLDLKDSSARALADWVTEDPDYQAVPDSFSDDNAHLFFRFFDKYGLYYITGVTVGSRIYYSSSVSKSYGYSEDEIKAKLKLEYKAVLTEARGEAQSDWKRVGRDWTNRREVRLYTLGGDSSILDALAPGFDDSFNDEYKRWQNSVAAKPAVVDFRLAAIAKLFSGTKAIAVQQASDAYIRSRLYAESKTGTCLLSFNGRQLLPPGGGDRVYGFQLAAIDREKLTKAWAKSYSVRGDTSFTQYQARYDEALMDLIPYRNDKYIVAFTTWSMFGVNCPTEYFYEFLRELGAGPGLQDWAGVRDLRLQDPTWGSADIAHCNYALVGVPGSGPGTGIESFSRAGSNDTGQHPWFPPDGWSSQPAAPVSVDADVYRVGTAEPTHAIAPAYGRNAHPRRSAPVLAGAHR